MSLNWSAQVFLHLGLHNTASVPLAKRSSGVSRHSTLHVQVYLNWRSRDLETELRQMKFNVVNVVKRWLSRRKTQPPPPHPTRPTPRASVQHKIPRHGAEWTSPVGKTYPRSYCKCQTGQCLCTGTWKDAQPQSTRTAVEPGPEPGPPCVERIRRLWFGTHTRRTSSLILRWCRKELCLGLTTDEPQVWYWDGAKKSFVLYSHQRNLVWYWDGAEKSFIWDSQTNLKSDLEMVQKRAFLGDSHQPEEPQVWYWEVQKRVLLGTYTRRTSSPTLRWCRKELPDASSMISANQLVPVPSSTDEL